jgi:hypothetical protein
MKSTGEIVAIFPLRQVTEKFAVRDFAVKIAEGNPKYPQTVLFQAQGEEALDTLAGCAEMDYVEVEWELKGRAWTNKEGETKYFNTVRAFKIHDVRLSSPGDTKGDAPTPPRPQPSTKTAPPPKDAQESLDSDLMPF